MIAEITPPPCEAQTLQQQWNLWERIAAYSLGLVASTTLMGALAASIGSIIALAGASVTGHARWWIAGLAFLALAYSLHELVGLRVPMPQIMWQVPVQWSRHGKMAQALMYGVVLGADIFTLVPYASLYVLLLLEVTLGLPRGIAIGFIYGCARATPTAVGIILAHYRLHGPAPTREWLARARTLFHVANGLVLAGTSGALLGLLR